MRVVDLSLPVSNEMAGVQIRVAKQLEVDGWNASTLELYSHCGTHMDAPCHFLPGGATIDQQNLEVCVGPAEVLNFAPSTPSQLLTVADIERYADRIVPGVRLLFRTDWHQQFGEEHYRSGLPRISLELAHWLVEQRVALIGVEGPSVADVNNMEELTEVHQALFRGNVLIVEGLAHLDQLTQTTVEFIALPMLMPGIDGSPTRAIAIER
ncbi:MAG: cyclase family protein [Planctomycetota bacterium]